jgi:ABC-type antimicrobial peptide transport system permease subunit
MIENYIKIAWRNLFRNKGFSFVNIFGLATGITCTILISLWVQNELDFDKDQKNYNDVYQVVANRNFNNQVFTDYNMAFPLGPSLEDGYPQIKNAVVVSGFGPSVLSFDGKKIKKNGLSVSSHFFDVFSFNFLKGNPQTAIRDEGSIVLTESGAKAFFGNDDPINKVLKIDNKRNAKVTAIIADLPTNSSFTFEYLEPYSAEFIKSAMPEWVNSFSYVYVQTLPGADIKTLDENINTLIKKHVPEDHVSTYFSFPMSKWHLESDFKDGINNGGMIDYVKLFSIIAIIILVIACINFMNLSTARSEKKAKEVGVRKTLGSNKKQLIFQFLSESMLITFLAFIISIATVYLLLPSFNLLVNKQLSLPVSEPIFWIASILLILFTGFVSGSYPAIYLSSFNPATVLKGTILAGKKALIPRRVLVTGQFIISILLISATIIVYQQIQYLKNRPKGYNSENLIFIPASPDLNKNFKVLKQELLKNGYVDAVTRTSSPVTESSWNSPAPDWEGKSKNEEILVSLFTADVDFTKTIDLKIIQGKEFTGMPSDPSAMILNKTAVKAMGLKNPIGMEMRFGKSRFNVIGVVDDIITESPYKQIKPLIILYNDANPDFIHIRLNPSAPISQSIKSIEAAFTKYNPAYPFEYQFVNESYNNKFIAEELIGKLTNIFAGLAIFICCIGLAGLTAFTIEKRTKELGIRKVLGATLKNLVFLISNEFVKLVIIALVITIPITWILMNKWLKNYEYHINISMWPFIIVGITILSLTLLIVLFNTFKTSRKNPVKSLRTE